MSPFPESSGQAEEPSPPQEERGESVGASPPAPSDTQSDSQPEAEGGETGQAGRAESRRLLWLSLALVPAVAGLLLIGYLPIKRASQSMTYEYQLDREEGFLLNQAIQLVQGKTIYPSVEDYPYVVGNYPPVYPALLGGMLTVFQPSLPLGRALVLIATIVVLASLVNIVVRETDLVLPALLSVGLFLATWEVNNWVAFARVDLPALAIGLGGLAAITSPKRRSGLAMACALFTLAFFTKQTQVVAPVAAALGLAWVGDWKRFWLLTGVLIASIAALLLVLQLSTGGQFLLHTVTYNANEYDLDQVRIWLRQLWRFGSFKLVAAALALLVLPVIWRHQLWEEESEGEERLEDKSRPSLTMAIAAFYVILSAVTLLSTGKAGAAGNYLLEFHAATALFLGLTIGLTIRRLGRRESPHQVFAFVSGLLVLLLWLHVFDLGFRTIGGRRKVTLFEAGPSQLRLDMLSRVRLRVGEAEGPVLAEEPIFAILNAKPVLFQPFIMSQLAIEGRWDQGPFVADLLNGRFSLIVTTQDVREEGFFWGFTEQMRDAIRNSYRLEQRIGGYFIFVPESSPIREIESRTQLV